MRKSILETASILLLVTSVISHAEPAPSIDDIVKQREAVLSQIVEYAQKQYDMAIDPIANLRNAQIELYTLRRDSAKTNQDRIQWQKQIVATEKENVSALDGSQTVVRVEVLKAKERYLAAQQKLLELEAAK